MSTTLTRCWDLANHKYIYSDGASCEYDECWNDATKQHGVYCDATFYARCYDTTEKVYKVTVDCCGSVPGTCCNDGGDSMPQYCRVEISGVLDCGTNPTTDCTQVNGIFILSWLTGCYWTYEEAGGDYTYIQVHIGGTDIDVIGKANMRPGLWGQCFYGLHTPNQNDKCNKTEFTVSNLWTCGLCGAGYECGDSGIAKVSFL